MGGMRTKNRRRWQAGLFPVLLSSFLGGTASAAELKVAVFDFELIDTSLEGELLGKNAGETARLEIMAPRLREDLAAEADLTVVDIAAVRDEARSQKLQSCGNCTIALGREIGADIVVTGTVQKVSNLILNVNVYAKRVATGELVGQGSADIRSNTDESWLRGLKFLWTQRLKGQLEAARR